MNKVNCWNKTKKKNSSLSWVSRIILLQEMQRSGITLVDLWLLLFSYWRSLHTWKNGVRQVKCNHAKKMSSYGTLWLFLLQCFGVRKSYYKQVILCISSTDFEGPYLVPESPLTNQITKRLKITSSWLPWQPAIFLRRCLTTESNKWYTWFLSSKLSLS